MEPQEIFKEVMKSEEFQTHFGITKEEASAASYTSVSDHTPIEIITFTTSLTRHHLEIRLVDGINFLVIRIIHFITQYPQETIVKL